MRTRVLPVLIALSTLLFVSACGGATSRNADGNVIKIAGVNLMCFSPAFVAEKLGYFDDEASTSPSCPPTAVMPRSRLCSAAASSP